MSNRGAIKKTSESKTASQLRSQVRTKSHKSQESLDRTSKYEVEKEKERLRIDQNAGGDSRSRTSHSTINKSTTKSTPRNSSTHSQSKSTHKNGVSSLSKPTISSSSRTSSISSKQSSKTISEIEKKIAKHAKQTESSKSKEKIKTIISEKRGSSTIYIPKNNASKLNSSSTRQSTNSKILEMQKHTDKNSKVKPTKEKRQSSKERRKSRTLSPSEVRVLHSAVGTRTQVENKTVEIEGAVKPNSDEDNEYEDDFESYESDFEECTDSDVSPISEETDESRNSPVLEPVEMRTLEKKKVVSSYEVRKTEEEWMLDSGHYELAEARKRAAKIESMSLDSMSINRPKTPPLPELIQPVNQSYREEKQSENKSLPLSMDEGFEDGRSGDFAKSPPISQISESSKTMKLNKEKKELNKALSRGRELMTMIKLDTVGWSLYESAPIAYEEFIRNYGKLNTQQMSTQTNDDNLEVETQTEEIESSNKWTQFPITCRKNLTTNEDIRMFKKEQIGVGNDEDESNLPVVPSYDILQLNDFMERAGKVMLCLLEERRFGGNILQNNNHEMPFSAGYINLSINSLTFLSGRPVTLIVYSEILDKILLTIHAPGDEDIETTNKQDYITDCCIGCVWNISEPSRPTKVIYSQSPITSCCFHPTSYSIIFAGLNDGSINLWDLREDEMWHQKVTDKDNEIDWVIRTPTYTTSGNSELDGHKSEIVALRVLSKVEKNVVDILSNKFLPIQICSLDDEGCLIIWSVLHTMTKNVQDLGLTHWGDVKLVKSQEVPLFFKDSELDNQLRRFFDLNVDSVDNNDLYISTNTSDILHANCIRSKPNPFVYKGDELDWCGNTTCIEKCPFKQSFFLVGCDDGTVRLHSLNVEKALLQLKNDQCTSAVKTIQWSKSKPFTLFVLDDHSQIHIWDLSQSDIFPTYSISTKSWDRVRSLRLSPCNFNHDMVNQYLAIGTETGRVEVHKLSEDFFYSQPKYFFEEMNSFLRYVTVL